MTDLRDKIARALKAVSDEQLTDAEFEMFGDTPVTDFYPEADAVLAVLDLDTIRAEAFEAGVRSAVDAVNSTPPSNLKPYLRGAEQ